MGGIIAVGRQQAQFVRDCFDRGGIEPDHEYGDDEQEERVEFSFFKRTSTLSAAMLLITDDIGFVYRWMDG
jgi:hypothetical protein